MEKRNQHVIRHVELVSRYETEDDDTYILAESDDVPGLVIEAKNGQHLMELAKELVPLFLHEAGIPTSNQGIEITVRMPVVTMVVAPVKVA